MFLGQSLRKGQKTYTTPMGGTLKGASLIGATVNIATYLATINPSQYSIGGALIAGGTGAVSSQEAGRASADNTLKLEIDEKGKSVIEIPADEAGIEQGNIYRHGCEQE